MTKDDLKIGNKVRSCLNDDIFTIKWYTGTIYNITYRTDDVCFIDINRDDKKSGGGYNDSWRTRVTPSKIKGMELLIGDWDE